jgi:RND family efflux transporter MFP subunit
LNRVGVFQRYSSQDELGASVREARARVAREEALLTELTAPLRSDKRAVEEAALAQARTSVVTAVEGLYTAFAHAFTYADDALHEEADELFTTTNGGTPAFDVRFTYGTTKYILQGSAEEEISLSAGRVRAGEALLRVRAAAEDRSRMDEGVIQGVEEDLSLIEAFLSELATVVNRYVPDDTSAQAVYESFQTSVASARSSLSSARSEVRAASATYEAAIAARDLREREYALSVSGVTSETRAVQEAAIRVAREAALRTEETLDLAVLRAPRSGTIAQLDVSVGEPVAAHATIGELLTEGAYEVETYIPEADIARVKIGDRAVVTFDAFERAMVFDAEVSRIAVSETVREGVPTYRTTLTLLTEVPSEVVLRPGMTADIDITTDTRENVLSVPTRSVLMTADRQPYIRVLRADGSLEERAVTTGLRGSNGTIEVTAGVVEGERIVLFIEDTAE